MLSRSELAQLGRALDGAGLNAKRLALWCGTSFVSRLPHRFASALPARAPAAFVLDLLVAGRPAPLVEARARLGDALPVLLELELLEQGADYVVARRAVVPLVPALRRLGEVTLAVCDRWDVAATADSTPWPDGSSHHLCGALAGVAAGGELRPERWLDLGTGSGIAPLVHRTLAERVVGADLVVPTARVAALGAALSDHRRFHVAVSDLDDAIAGEWDLVSCNAPIPDDPDAPDVPAEVEAPETSQPIDAAGDTPWRRAPADFLDRLCQRIPRRLRRGGMAVVHGRHDAMERAFAALDPSDQGERVTIVYTPVRVAAPAGATGSPAVPAIPPFSVTWWQPHLPARRVVAYRELTVERPYLDERDLDDARNNRLPSLPADTAS